jgi:hypothetical protein
MVVVEDIMITLLPRTEAQEPLPPAEPLVGEVAKKHLPTTVGQDWAATVTRRPTRGVRELMEPTEIMAEREQPEVMV